MSEFVEVAQLDQVPPGRSSFVQVEDKSIALFKMAAFTQSTMCVLTLAHR